MRSTDRRVVAVLAAALLALAGVVAAAPAARADGTVVARINFQPANAPVPAGYTADTGQPYSDARGFGWVSANSETPVDLTANTRWRSSTYKDGRLSTLLQMQQTDYAHGGAFSTGRWEYAVPNGTYAVTVSVGDLCCTDSTHRILVEGVVAIAGFQPMSSSLFQSATVVVSVTDGRLTIDPAGGTNTKIDYVDVNTSTATPQPVTPLVTGVSPAAGSTQVPLNAAVSLDVNTPIAASSVTASTFSVTAPGGVPVAGNYNTDAAGGTASFTPTSYLSPNTTYTVAVTSGMQSTSGAAFSPYRSTFTTGTAPPPLAGTPFSRSTSVPVPKPTALVIGPDGRLYVGTGSGTIYRFDRAADGTLSDEQSVTPFGPRVVNGLAFDPSDPTTLYVSNNELKYSDASRFSGRVSKLTVPAGDLSKATGTDVIVGLPRSAHDHMTNGLTFLPDGRLVIAQGANTSYGAPDTYWGTRGESPLSASVLTAAVHGSAFASLPVDVNTDPVGTTEDSGSAAPVGYDPTATGAPVRVFASGVRNAYTVLADSNGSLYAPVNESAAGGASPASPDGTVPALTNVPAYDDYFTRLVQGGYYGHPNPSIGKYAVNGANPTAGADPWEVKEYPVGVAPDAGWVAPDMSMGVHRSPDGAAEYRATAPFGGALVGKVLVSEYSDGDDIVAITLDSSGRAVSEAAVPDAANPGGALTFDNPLGLATDPTSGVVYVAEYGTESDPTDGQVTLLTPGSGSAPVSGTLHVNFQPASAAVPGGYTADTGAPFNGQQGWQDATGAPLDLTANTRVRHSTASPDSRYDTMVLVQAPSGSGVTTPGRWVTTVPNGTYDATVGVGDATATNSVDEITARSGGTSVPVVDHYQPTTAAPFATATRRITVSDGTLTLDPTGGTNTKLDFVDVVPATTDTMPPQVSVGLSGPQASATSTTYTGPVSVTVTASDNVGVTATTLAVDGGAPAAYTAPVTVTGDGSHTVTATASDAAGNSKTATSTFTIDTSPPPPPTAVHVDFGAQTSQPYSGYVLDYGQAFDPVRGYGWEDDRTGAPASLVGNGRERRSTLSPDKRYDTLMQVQQLSAAYGGVTTPGRWEAALANGTYAVTVGVGDATATNSTDTVVAEPGTANQVTLVNAFVPTASAPFQTVTKTVTVSDGRLTLSPGTGTNGKIDFVDAVPVSGGTVAPPVVSVTLSGPGGSGGSYTGDVTVTATATDAGGPGIASVVFSLDGGPATAYTAPVVVTATGSHTIVVTATDRAGNAASSTTSWTESHPSSSTTAPAPSSTVPAPSSTASAPSTTPGTSSTAPAAPTSAAAATAHATARATSPA